LDELALEYNFENILTVSTVEYGAKLVMTAMLNRTHLSNGRAELAL